MGAAGGACIRCRERHAPALDGVGVRGSKRIRSAHATCAPFGVGAASRPASEHGERGSGSGPSPRRIEGRRGGADVHGSVGAALIASFASLWIPSARVSDTSMADSCVPGDVHGA
eukprot:scaffold544_cov320-Pavlova_lutheri.AAC.34